MTVFPYILYCGGQGLPMHTTIQMYGKTMILKMSYLMIDMSNLF